MNITSTLISYGLPTFLIGMLVWIIWMHISLTIKIRRGEIKIKEQPMDWEGIFIHIVGVGVLFLCWVFPPLALALILIVLVQVLRPKL